jgi:hypothetical protein
MGRRRTFAGRLTEGQPTWVALSMVLLIVGFSWYDSFRSSLLEGSKWSNASDDDAEWRTEMMDFLDEMAKIDYDQAQRDQLL